MRQCWSRRRKPLPEPDDVQPRHRGPHTWHWWDLLPLALFTWLAFRSVNNGAWLFSLWTLAFLALLAWGFAIPKDGSLGELARSLTGSGRGRLLAWLLFLCVGAGIAYAVYWLVALE